MRIRIQHFRSIRIWSGSGSSDVMEKHNHKLKYIYPRPPWRTSRPINRRNRQPSKVNIQHFKTVHLNTISFMLRQLCSTGSGSAVPADQNQCWSGSTTLTEGHAAGQTGKALNEESLLSRLTIKVPYCTCTSYIDMCLQLTRHFTQIRSFLWGKSFPIVFSTLLP